MVKRRLTAFRTFLLPFLLVPTIWVTAKDREERKKQKMEQAISALPDTAYASVRKEDLLNDEVYIKLARDGWNAQEISRIMNRYLKQNRSRVRGSFEYGMYAKQWLPTYGHTPGSDTIYQFVDTTYNETAIKSARRLFSRELAAYYEPIPYTPDDRMSGIRNTGYFRPVLQKPNTGRIHWIVVHPTDPDALMVVPDGAGIFRTSDLGQTWDCVTDRIPDREFRKICYHSAIPVDPDDWNHFFAFMKNGNATAVYETTDGGQSWIRVEGATHKSFKRGYGFRDSKGQMKFIGAVQDGGNYLNNQLWMSDDKGVSWKRITLPETLKETHPESGAKGAFFQNFAFHPTNRDMVYLPTSRSIYYFDDGVEPQTGTDGQTTFNIKRMTFDVYNQDGTELRASQVQEFPYKATSQGFLEINPDNPLQMWFASASRNVSYGVYSAVYRSDDGGKTWVTLQEPKNGIGSGLAFGNESPWGWLGGFGVNFKDPQWLYGCSMSSAISSDGGHTFKEYGWGNRLKALADDGNYYVTTSARHNADNHCIVSHRSGRVFRGSDAGLLVKDKAINNHEWTNINGMMGNQLHYSIKVNEFGDQTMLGNTQDVDAQTYRYGRWGHWRGYEGTEAFINPYAGTCYYSGSGGGSLDGISLSSWYEGYTMADVCTGYWYLIHRQGSDAQSFFRVEDFGGKAINLSDRTKDVSGAGTGARDFALTRAGGRPVLFVLNANNTIVRSTDNGNTFETVMVKSGGNMVPAKFSGAWIATDPNRSDIIYIGQTGKVLKYDLNTGEQENLSEGLPSVSCDDLIFHEGTGDLYFFSNWGGIYLRDHATGQWNLWMTGYNPLAAKRVALNYTTQEMVLGDYGRGVWVADLEHPADRYFSDGFKLRQLSAVNGRRTLGIDTEWTIPLYYNYTWTVNGSDVDNPYQYLTRDMKAGDRVRLKLTLRESPDVSTLSEEFIVPQVAEEIAYAPVPGNALYSDGSGRVDLGYVDYFFNDFTLDLWVKPETNGVVICNRPVELQKDTRGWALMVDQGVLKFRYAPAQLFERATYDATDAQQTDLSGGAVTFGQWMHVAVSQDRDGQVSLYVNGELKVSSTRIVQWAPLNSAVYLSLFADGFERMPMKGCVDELKIWNRALNSNDVRRAMFSHVTSDVSALVYYNDFNVGKLDEERELFSRAGMKPRIQAVTSAVVMPVAVGATVAEVKMPSGRTAYDAGNSDVFYLTPSAEMSSEVGIYRYTRLSPDNMGIDSRYFVPASDVFQIRTFGNSGETTADIELPFQTVTGYQYKLYACGLYDGLNIWQKVADVTVSQDGNTMIVKGVKLARIQDRLLVVLQNKLAVESTVSGATDGHEIVVYHPSQTDYEISAGLVGGLEEPTGIYEIMSETGLFKVADQMKFVNGKAVARLTLDIDRLEGETTLQDTIVGKNDSKMIPLPLTVRNRMLPEGSGKVLTIQGGGAAAVSNTSIINALNGSKTVTMMGWVRLDDKAMLSGVRPLFFFRGSNGGVCGLHLTDGNVRFHWNDGFYAWSSNLNITTNDLGRWMHLAFVASPDGFSVYLNGAEYYRTRQIEAAKINSVFMLGQNYTSDRWFKGAFDQVSLWNRSLSSDEIRYYMTDNPRLDDNGLVAYFDMDGKDDKGALCDRVTGAALTMYGQTSNEEFSHMPYHPEKTFSQNGTPEASQEISLEGTTATFKFALMNGASYNYVHPDHSSLNPLLTAHYAVIPSKTAVFSAGQKVTVNFNMPLAAVNSGAVLALRPLGSEEPFDSFVEMESVENGRMKFSVDATRFNGANEMMLMYDATAGERPVKVTLSATQYAEGDTIFLDETTDRIRVNSRVLSANPGSEVILSVVESDYAHADVDTLDVVGTAGQTITVTIDKSRLDKFAVNPVTLRLSGVSEPVELKLLVALEPIVKLSLADDEDGTQTVVATDPYASFGVKSELLQGVLRGNLNIKVVADMPTQTNTALGSLLSNNSVSLTDNLSYYTGRDELDEGWNLVGNPYLANINLTKEHNVNLHEDEIVKYLYQYNPESDTYTAWDMVENYDETQRLMPFQPFFVQTLQEGARLTIMPEAKSTTINRRVFDHYMLHESKMLRLGLYLENGTQADRTEVKVQDGTNPDFVLGEDAIKMWGGLNAKSNEMATVCGNRYMAVNVQPEKKVELPLYLRLSATGKFRIAMLDTYGYGLADKAFLKDKLTGTVWNLLDGDGYEFTVNETTAAADRFVLIIDVAGSADQVGAVESNRPQVIAGNGQCRIDGLTGRATVEVFDASGRRVVYETTDKESLTCTLHSGNYVVRVRMSNKDYSTKINIR